jgi:hypothetical protein
MQMSRIMLHLCDDAAAAAAARVDGLMGYLQVARERHQIHGRESGERLKERHGPPLSQPLRCGDGHKLIVQNGSYCTH